MVVTIDGPSGAGKSTVAKLAARELGFAYLDTGAIYRAVGLAARESGLDVADEDAVAAWLPGADIRVRAHDGVFSVLWAGKDVEPLIRNEAVGALASVVSAQAEVRRFLLEMQRAAGKSGDLVCEGRDMGTTVFPRAEVKIFLTASAEERARRRLAELLPAQPGLTLQAVLADMAARDERDSSRALSPLAPAPGAERLDTTGLTPAQVAARIVGLARLRGAGPQKPR